MRKNPYNSEKRKEKCVIEQLSNKIIRTKLKTQVTKISNKKYQNQGGIK